MYSQLIDLLKLYRKKIKTQHLLDPQSKFLEKFVVSLLFKI